MGTRLPGLPAFQGEHVGSVTQLVRAWNYFTKWIALLSSSGSFSENYKLTEVCQTLKTIDMGKVRHAIGIPNLRTD